MLKEGYKDEIRINTQIYLSWPDRLRVLLGRTVHISTRTQCENLPGKLETNTTLWVDPILASRHDIEGEVEISQ